MTEPQVDAPLCDKQGCQERAVFSYTWDWGQHGVCCAKHQVELAQTSKQLERGVQFVALSAGAAPPVERAERIALISGKLAAEAELDEAKLRGVELYNQNTQLIAQVQSLTLRAREREAQLTARNAELAEAESNLRQRDAQLADALDELGRLRVLVARPAVGGGGGGSPVLEPGVVTP